MVGAFNINKKLHSDVYESVIDAKSSDYNTIGSLTAYKCQGFTKLMVQYIVSSTSWDRAGDIIIYGSFTENGTYTSPDATIENATFGVLSTDDGNEGKGEYYVVENVMPWIKIGWDNTTTGGTGTISVTVMPFND
ncbi:MAG: hypothetical protein KKH44_08410 [Bacteroidetes bacterium]|nr:hypothetical protein [Bacteroidota bacterium]